MFITLALASTLSSCPAQIAGDVIHTSKVHSVALAFLQF